MIEKRAFGSLGGGDHGWLKTRHHFSFADYHDPARMGFGALRVWNDDEIAPGTGFGLHGHADMEIITYVREGAISHEDSLGSRGRTVAGDVQVMSAGRGIRHSEFNHEATPTRIFQIWILPSERGGEPRWETASFPKRLATDGLVPLASGFGEPGVAVIRARARVLGASLPKGQQVRYVLAPGRHGYLVPARGHASVNGFALGPGDGLAVKDEGAVTVEAVDDLELVLVDAP